MQPKEEKTKAEGKAEQLGHRPPRVWWIHESLREVNEGGKWEVGHHCEQGGGAENEVDCAEQMATGETPALCIKGLNKETFCTSALDSRQH